MKEDEMTAPATSSTFTLNGCRTTRIYCRPVCPAGRRTKPENRVHFQSRDDAIAQGYRACKICKPDGPQPEIETLLVEPYSSPLGTYLIITSPRANWSTSRSGAVGRSLSPTLNKPALGGRPTPRASSAKS